jgi:hypothetical protein
MVDDPTPPICGTMLKAPLDKALSRRAQGKQCSLAKGCYSWKDKAVRLEA